MATSSEFKVQMTSTREIEAICSSEKLVTTLKCVRRYKPDDHTQHVD